MTNFKREDRYLVIKRSDIKHLSKADQQQLDVISARICIERQARGKDELECVVVESDWPEYEPVFKMIEARVAGSN